jgi:HEAT repeat protein
MRLAVIGFLGLSFATSVPFAHAQDAEQRSWEILEAGQMSSKQKERVEAVRALGLLVRNPRAEKLAEDLLVDKTPAVRAAAAMTLGQIGMPDSIPLMKKALNDKDDSVVIAASNGLILYGDPSGFNIYFELLMGERRAGDGAIGVGERMVKDPKAMSLIALGVAAGFAPYAGYAWAAIQVLAKDYTGPVLVDAADKLASGTNSGAAEALVKAASNKRWKVRVAALKALAHLGDQRALESVLLHLSDKNYAVKCTAAAAVIQLSNPIHRGTQQSNAIL